MQNTKEAGIAGALMRGAPAAFSVPHGRYKRLLFPGTITRYRDAWTYSAVRLAVTHQYSLIPPLWQYPMGMPNNQAGGFSAHTCHRTCYLPRTTLHYAPSMFPATLLPPATAPPTTFRSSTHSPHHLPCRLRTPTRSTYRPLPSASLPAWGRLPACCAVRREGGEAGWKRGGFLGGSWQHSAKQEED